ncbi:MULTISPECIES: helix-turn-helix domain-containing protein [Micromonospora]|uniref:helix-turn-helix domain-containing protein n=1 Tax=Micromonospora TaxID=1873 RepID=UPI0007C64078|nr:MULTISPECIES: helix-turn-helix transcriptional regulator [Micromonospora]
MAETADRVDLGGSLRALRRRADLSQRELADLAGVPQATLARIESGRSGDVRFRTVERLVRAAGGRVAIGIPGDQASDDRVPEVVPVPGVPHDGLRDAAGRRYPPHLDAWEVHGPRDWPGAWWAGWWNLPPQHWPRRLPAATYELSRERRDRRRWGERIRREVTVRRVTDDGLPGTCWRFVAELPDGRLVGELRAHERDPRLLYGDLIDAGEREIVLDGVLVAGPCRLLGIGQRLVAALTAEMERAGIRVAHAVADFGGVDLLLACGYRIEGRGHYAMRLDRAWLGAALLPGPAPLQP